MTLKNPIGMIKDVATASLKVPLTVAGTAVDLAKGAVSSVVGNEKDIRPRSADQPTKEYDDAGSAEEPAAAPKIEITPDKPVNVTEELGLDPAPVGKPKKKPITKIDAAAHPEDVDVTPADVARAIGESGAERPTGQP